MTRYKFTEADKTRFIIKNELLTEEQKKEILQFFAEHPEQDSKIKDWNSKIPYSVFDKVMYDFDNDFDKLPTWTIDDLEEGVDYDYLGEYIGYNFYFIYTHKASVTFASNNVPPEIWSPLPSWYNKSNAKKDYIYLRHAGLNCYSGAKWCTAMNHQNENRSFMREYIQDDNQCFIYAISIENMAESPKSKVKASSLSYINKYAIIIEMLKTEPGFSYYKICDGFDRYREEQKDGKKFERIIKDAESGKNKELQDKIYNCIKKLSSNYDYDINIADGGMDYDTYKTIVSNNLNDFLQINDMMEPALLGGEHSKNYKLYCSFKDIVGIPEDLYEVHPGSNFNLEDTYDYESQANGSNYFFKDYFTALKKANTSLNTSDMEKCVRYLFDPTKSYLSGGNNTKSLMFHILRHYFRMACNYESFNFMNCLANLYIDASDSGNPWNKITDMFFDDIDVLEKEIKQMITATTSLYDSKENKLLLEVNTVYDLVRLFMRAHLPKQNDPLTIIYNTVPETLLNHLKLDDKTIPYLYRNFVHELKPTEKPLYEYGEFTNMQPTTAFLIVDYLNGEDFVFRRDVVNDFLGFTSLSYFSTY